MSSHVRPERRSHSIVRSTMTAMSIRVLVIVILATVASYFHLYRTVKTKVLSDLENNTKEKGSRESDLFRLAEDNHEILKKHFYEQMKQYNKLNPDKEFAELFVKYKDGTTRNRPDRFHGDKHPSVFLPPDLKITTDIKRKVLAMFNLTYAFGSAWRNRFQNTYFTTPEKITVVLWPEEPEWSLKLKANFDIRQEEYYWVADKIHNPERHTVWTGVYQNSISKQWMTSVETPIDDEKQNHLATIGHDIMLDELMSRTLSSQKDGTYNFIFRKDGRLIAHPNHMSKLKESFGHYYIFDSADHELVSLYEILKDSFFEKSTIENKNHDQHVTIHKIAGPNWYYASVLPNHHLRGLIWRASAYIGFIGLFALVAELIVLYFLIRKNFFHPLSILLSAMKKIRHGNLDTRVDLQRDDEWKVLASTFNHMTESIEKREKEIEFQNSNLEKLVEERTVQLEQQRVTSIQAAKMATLGEMASGIAHEINNPLTIIHVRAATMRSAYDEGILKPKDIHDGLQKIEDTSMRIAQIIKGLRSFSRRADQDPMTSSSIQNILSDTLGLCQERLKNLDIDLRIVPFDDIFISCQPTQISQVLINLIGNACDAVEKQKERWIEIAVTQSQGFAKISVTDSGPGIDEETAQKMMQPFYTTKPVGKGTGLGLSISKGLVEAQKGKFYHEKQSQNTRFVIEIPLSHDDHKKVAV